MPYIDIAINDEVIGRRELGGSIIVGRAPECAISLRDILLSRRHCRLEPGENGWLAVDLNSKNGTRLNGERFIEPVQLKDGDLLQLGRAKIFFRAMAMSEGEIPLSPRFIPPANRPADPSETLSGTLTAFTLLEPGETPREDAAIPAPRPRPKDPAAYERADIRELLTAIASSSWDSIYAEARQPSCTDHNPMESVKIQPVRRVRPSSPIDFSLQAPATEAQTRSEVTRGDECFAEQKKAEPVRRVQGRAAMPGATWRSAAHEGAPRPQSKMRRRLSAIAGGLWIGIAILGIHRWMDVNSLSTPAAGAAVAVRAYQRPVDLTTAISAAAKAQPQAQVPQAQVTPTLAAQPAALRPQTDARLETRKKLTALLPTDTKTTARAAVIVFSPLLW